MGIATPRSISIAEPRESGIALVAVLMALAAILMLGVGTLVLTNSNLMVAQNLAGNAIARANAEAGIDATVAAMRASFEADGKLPISVTTAPLARVPDGELDYAFASPPEWRDNQVVLQVAGHGPRNAEYVSEALVSFGAGTTAGGSPFTGAVIGCEKVALNGSGAIDSFDSRKGLYQIGTRGRNASVSTLTPGAPITLTGDSAVYGPINSTGDFGTQGSSSVYGDINASGSVLIDAHARYAGDIRTTGSIEFKNDATVDGAVSANGDITFSNGAKVGGDASAGGSIVFKNSGASVAGNASAHGMVTRTHGDASATHVIGMTMENSAPIANLAVPSEPCDPLGIVDVMAAFKRLPSAPNLSTGSTLGRTFNLWRFSPDGVQHFDETWNVRDWTADTSRVVHDVSVFGREARMIKTGSLTLGYGEFRIMGGDVAIFVDGDLTLGNNGGNGLIIDEGSSLTVFVTGKTTIGSAVKMSNLAPVSKTGVPTFSLYSNYGKGHSYENGISIGGDSRLTANIYAPLTKVSVNAGGGLYGGARGREVEVTGGAAVHYDEALGAVDMGGGGGSKPTSGTVQILSRR